MLGTKLRNSLPVLALAPLLLGTAPDLFAQYNGRDGGWRGPRSGAGSPYARPGTYRTNPVDTSLRDLQSIFSRARVDNHEANHFRKAIDKLIQFDERARRGKFDRGKLDDAIDNMEHLARADQLHPRDRARIREDMFALRTIRNRGDWRF
ncbi:MAG: hypothetical protein R2729_22020 [Bryobacteraceae bacterium]